MSALFGLARKALFALDAETAHGLTLAALKKGIVPPCPSVTDPRLQVEIAGLRIPNPVGIAAGFDKNAEVPDAMLRLGFGFAEIGTVTPRPQAGNPRPRIFRLTNDGAVINRLGFNNEGHAAALARLTAREARGGIVGVNVGANKDSSDFAADYVSGIETFFDLASYFTVNISSPNTPGLRDLQARDALSDLLKRVLGRRNELSEARGVSRPVFLKIAPDLAEAQMDDIAAVATKVVTGNGLDGLIVSNTTLSRHGLAGNGGSETGGLSGQPLFERSTIVLARMRQRVGALPIIGVGGVDSGETALEKLRAGASAVQLYTGMVYRGPTLARDVNAFLQREIDRLGVANIAALSGVATDKWASRKIAGE